MDVENEYLEMTDTSIDRSRDVTVYTVFKWLGGKLFLSRVFRCIQTVNSGI